MDVGLCDDQNKPENSFKNWITNVQTSLGFSKTDIPAQEPLAALSSKGTLHYRKTMVFGFVFDERCTLTNFSYSCLCVALDMFNGKEPITSKLVYRHFEGQRVIMVRLKTNPEKNRGQNWRVQVGDHIAVYPQNSKENVLRLIETVAFKSTRGSKSKLQLHLKYFP